MKAQLCQCLICEAIMIDENPNSQPELEIPNGALDMEFGEDENGFYKGCPNCHTDEHLIDLYALPKRLTEEA